MLAAEFYTKHYLIKGVTMARTKAETRADVILNTGRSDKADYIDRQIDNAVKVASINYIFSDTLHICDDVTLVEDATSVSISALEESSVAIGTVIDIATARIIQSPGQMSAPLLMKNRQWWDKSVINAEDNMKGWPKYGLKVGTNILFDRPLDDNLLLRLRAQSIPTYATEDSECPIEILDTFVEQYVTAMTFLSISMMDKYVSWYIMALGRDYDKRGIPGGSLVTAMNKDRNLAAEDKRVDGGRHSQSRGRNGVSITNDTVGEPNYGNTVGWY
jgi:hypothetical protein